MKCESFIEPRELLAFVTSEGITQTKIVDIEFANGRWWLFYFV